MIASPSFPDVCDVAFKEWAGVCESIASGQQSLILRKGGIAEGPNGFVPEHSRFWLYPTHVHELQQGLRIVSPPLALPQAPSDHVEIKALVCIEHIDYVADRERLARIEEFHVWTTDTVTKRFEYRKPGLWVLCIRAFCRAPGLLVKMTPDHAGCKTWVPIDAPLSTEGLVPVLDDETHAARVARIKGALRSRS